MEAEAPSEAINITNFHCQVTCVASLQLTVKDGQTFATTYGPGPGLHSISHLLNSVERHLYDTAQY